MRPASLLLGLGIVLLLLGILALTNPLAASLAVTTIVGVAFLFGGAVQLWLAFSTPDDPQRLWHGFIGLLALVAGVSLLADPLGGMVSLTVLLGVLFIATGVARLLIAYRNRETPLFWVLLLSGALSVVIGAMIFGNLADAATVLLGLLLGIELLAEGLALIVLGLLARRL
ncbi:HdeD family acid-resistance protein [Frigidibacter sp. ROC022]|uniref:HdeD family acid-resistance protein n=1 Tax=Frigidibacter sp. ROC022 TaxID=2971796 RepID=UPI00215A4D06|nr:DUF308 domain-containing protein [Frigidibacter sp. ROC022]MCR8724255.1 DUF308 domain-containing protein [Frigidibacter sp. ROC022]